MQYVTNWTQPAQRRLIFPVWIRDAPSSVTVTTVGRVRIVMLQNMESQTVDGIYTYNYATVAGNVYVALYKQVTTDTAQDSVLVAQSDSTVLNGASASQFIPFQSVTQISAGTYYIAVEFSDATHTFGGFSPVTTAGFSDSFSGLYYDRGGGYGAPTTPCPATTKINLCPWLILRVYKP